jgi:antirestriction protein ArdC
MTRKDMYQEVTALIIEALENDVRPWVQPWGDAPALSMPLRHNGEAYNGINVLILWSIAQKKGFSNPYWMTYRQAQELGGQVRKGEKAAPVFYAGKLKLNEDGSKDNDPAEDDADGRIIHYMKSYAVFNAAQIDGLPDRYAPAPLPVIAQEDMQRIPEADLFLTRTGADIRNGESRAYFDILADYIALPDFAAFKSVHGFYSTAFHELAHWSGHKSRLDRIEKADSRRSKEYAFEELIAEISAAFLCADHGIATDFEGQHVAYIQSWIQLLKDDKKAIFRAASMAQKAADYLHGLQGDKFTRPVWPR